MGRLPLGGKEKYVKSNFFTCMFYDTISKISSVLLKIGIQGLNILACQVLD